MSDDQQGVNVAPPLNPLLERARIPGQTFALPSGGVFYTHGEIDESARNGEVLVHPMVTIDEIAMKTPDKLLNGTALEEVFRRCIPQVLKPLQLLAKDVDFLLICLRKVTYGDQLVVQHTHTCASAQEHKYKIAMDPLISTAKRINTSNAREQYTITLPNQQVVAVSPPRYEQVLSMSRTFAADEATQEQMVLSILDVTASLVDSVDGIDDRGMIREWVEAIPAGYVTQISERVGELATWGPNQVVQLECLDCGELFDYEVSLNPIDFFS